MEIEVFLSGYLAWSLLRLCLSFPKGLLGYTLKCLRRRSFCAWNLSVYSAISQNLPASSCPPSRKIGCLVGFPVALSFPAK